MMNPIPLRDWFDNPIFIKHARSRLRGQPLAAGAVVVVVLCICIAWAGYENDAFLDGRAFEWLVVLQGIILIIMGAWQVSEAVGGARQSGIIDFHRVSPLTPAELTLGFFFGPPIREYALFACTLPFAALFLAFGVPSVHGFIEIMIFLVAIAWVFHGFALLNSLIMKGQRSARGAVGVAVYFVVVFVNALRMGRILPSMVLFDEDARLTFYGASIPWLAVVLLYAGGLLFFLYLAARRRMGDEKIHPFSKPQAIATLSALSFLMLGGIWRREKNGVIEIVALYLLVIAAIVLVLVVTPTQAEYVKGLWRAKKQGRARLSWSDDLALNRIVLLIKCVLVLVVATAIPSALADPAAGVNPAGSSPGNFPLASAVGVLVVAYVGLAVQYFVLRFGRRGVTYFALFLFLAWLVPLMGGTILAMASVNNAVTMPSQVFFGMTPIAGLAMVAAQTNDGSMRTAIEGPAIAPALLFTFVFNSLLTSARRRVHQEFLISANKSDRTGNAPSPARAKPAVLETDTLSPHGEAYR